MYVIFAYCLTIKGFRSASHQANGHHMLVCRQAFAPLFYGFNHPKYQVALLNDMSIRAQIPNKLIDYINNTEAFNISGDDN